MKTNLKLFAPLMTLVLLSGCAAEMVKKNYGANRGGTVKYSTAWFMGDKNRAKAIEEMNAYCGSNKAQLVSERSESEFTGQTYSNSNISGSSMSTNSSQSKEHFVYLNFKCVKPRSRG